MFAEEKATTTTFTRAARFYLSRLQHLKSAAAAGEDEVVEVIVIVVLFAK